MRRKSVLEANKQLPLETGEVTARDSAFNFNTRRVTRGSPALLKRGRLNRLIEVPPNFLAIQSFGTTTTDRFFVVVLPNQVLVRQLGCQLSLQVVD